MGASDLNGKELHLSFVEMLFALAIGEVAITVSNLVNMNSQGLVAATDSIPAYIHLLLATAVIATSWVGWRCSKSSGTQIKSVFSFDFIVLGVDVFLVICYFLLVRFAELPSASSDGIVSNASLETRMIAIIMGAYFVWDILSCVSDRGKLKRRVWASALCFVISLVALWILPVHFQSATVVILIDVALLGLVFLFRAMKLHDWGQHTPGSKLAISVSLLVLLVCSILACRVAHLAEVSRT